MLFSTRRFLRNFVKEFADRTRSATLRGSSAISTEMTSALSALGVVEGDTLLLLADETDLIKVMPAPLLGGLVGNGFRDHLLYELCAFLGPTGTLVLPLEFYIDPKYISHSHQLFDSRSSYAVGLGGRLRAILGSYCSVAPILSLVAVGREAKVLMSGQTESAPFPMGRGSPWEKLLKMGTKVALVGKKAVNTPLLLPAHLQNDHYERPSFFHKPFNFMIVDDDGAKSKAEFKLHACPFHPKYDLGNYADFDAFMIYMDEKYNLYNRTKLGSISITLYSYSHQYEMQELERINGVYLEDAQFW